MIKINDFEYTYNINRVVRKGFFNDEGIFINVCIDSYEMDNNLEYYNRLYDEYKILLEEHILKNDTKNLEMNSNKKRTRM